MKILNCITLSWIVWLIIYLIGSFVAADFDIRNWQDRGVFIFVSIIVNTFVVLFAYDIQSNKE